MLAIAAALPAAVLFIAACGGPQPTAPPPALPLTNDGIPSPAPGTTPAPLAITSTAESGQSRPEPPTALTWVLNHPEDFGLSEEREFSLQLTLDPKSRGVSGVQFTLQFPAESVQVLDVAPGSLLGPEPLVIEQGGTGGGQGAGEYVLAMARSGKTLVPTAAGPLAEIHLKEDLGAAQSGDITIRIAQVKVVDESFKIIENPTLTGSMSQLR